MSSDMDRFAEGLLRPPDAQGGNGENRRSHRAPERRRSVVNRHRRSQDHPPERPAQGAIDDRLTELDDARLLRHEGSLRPRLPTSR